MNNLASNLQDSDPRAALEAAQAGIALSRRLGVRSFNLMDNAYNAAMRTGEWDWVEAEFAPLLGEELDPLLRGVVLSDLLTLRAFRGEPTSGMADDLEAIPTSGADPVKEGTLAWSRAATAYASGRYDVARTQWHRFADVFSQGALEAFLLAGRCALLARDSEGARGDLAKADAVGRRGRAIDADRRTIRAGLAALDGQPREALALYREAMLTWRDLGLIWDEASCAIDMATLLGPDEPEVSSAAERAREILTQLEAKPFLERLESAMSAPTDRAKGKVAPIAERTTAAP